MDLSQNFTGLLPNHNDQYTSYIDHITDNQKAKIFNKKVYFTIQRNIFVTVLNFLVHLCFDCNSYKKLNGSTVPNI